MKTNWSLPAAKLFVQHGNRVCFQYAFILFLFVCFTIFAANDFLLFSQPQLGTENFNSKMMELLAEANRFYNIGEYQKALEIDRKIEAAYSEFPLLALADENPLELAFSLNADCYLALKKIDLAEGELQKIMHLAEKGYFPENAGKRARLKISNLFYQAGSYSKALKFFQDLAKDQTDKAHSDYINDKISDIHSRLKVVFHGKVNLQNNLEKSGVSARVFNGFTSESLSLPADGVFAIPVFDSTPGTLVAIFFLRDGYSPLLRTMTIPRQEKEIIETIILQPLRNPDFGVLTGLCYKTVRGGKLVPRHGISSLESGTIVTTQAVLPGRVTGKVYTTNSTAQGFYRFLLPPGSYRLAVAGRTVANGLSVAAGKTTIQNIELGETKLD